MIAPWAEQEMATADLGDERLDARAVVVLSALGQRPNLSIPAACGGQAEMTAAYRFFDNDKVTFEKVLEPHIARTRWRVAAQAVVLLVQDSSEIDLTRPEQVVISAQNRNLPGRRGPGQMYLASPLTVAASAVAGYIVEYEPSEKPAPVLA